MRVLLAAAFACVLSAADPATLADWPHYGGSYSAWRYSALSQIDRSNVARLAPAFVFQTGDYENGLQATPVAVDGVLYLSTSNAWVYAIDGATEPTHAESTAVNEALQIPPRQIQPGPAWRRLRDAPTPRQQTATTVADVFDPPV